jgi:hypothetical protein
VDWSRRDFRPISLPATPGAVGAETFTDMVLRARGGTLLSVLFGPEKPDQRTLLTMAVDLPKPTNLVLHILTVSHRANLRVQVDGQTAAEFPFETELGKGQDFESTKQFPEYGGIYQAKFNKDRIVTLPAGKHVITLENTTGDWLEIGTYMLQGVLSSRYSGLRPLALQDRATGETLLWLQDPTSNWTSDRDGKTPRGWEGVRAAIPLSVPGRYTAEWWDTRTGTILRRSPVPPRGGSVTLTVPSFRRDIALRLRRAE